MTEQGGTEALRAARTRMGSAVQTAHIPSTPGVYCWWFAGQPVYVAAVEDLASQLQQLDTRAGRRPVPPFRQFARGQMHLLGELERGANVEERRAAIDQYISRCRVAWVSTSTLAEAELLAAQVSQEWLESELWTARPGEDHWLRRWLDAQDGPGRVYVEVPIGGSGGRTRRIDAVRFPALGGGVRYHDRESFVHDVERHPCQVIEVKRTLNRTVIGQLIVARDLAATEWTRVPDLELDLIAVVTQSDAALEPVCRRHGIQVHKVQRLPEDRLVDIEMDT